MLLSEELMDVLDYVQSGIIIGPEGRLYSWSN